MNNFINDTLDGIAVWYDSASHKPTRSGQMKKGLETGEWSYFFAGTNRLSHKGEFKDGVENGAFTRYDAASGKVTLTGQFSDGKKTGNWRYYDPKTGRIFREEGRAYDKLEGYRRFFDSTGKVTNEAFYEADKLQGERKAWYPVTHKIKSIVHYKDDAYDGELKTYYPDGKVKRIEHYIDKKRVDSVCYKHDGTEEAYYPFYLKPSFPGDLAIYTETYIRYPYPARAVKKGGAVLVEFWVDEEGGFSDIRIIEGLGGTCDEAALVFVANMPLWNPGKLDGEPASMRTWLMVNFILKSGKVEAEQL